MTTRAQAVLLRIRHAARAMERCDRVRRVELIDGRGGGLSLMTHGIPIVLTNHSAIVAYTGMSVLSTLA